MRDSSPTSSVGHRVAAICCFALAVLFLSSSVLKGIDAPAFRELVGKLLSAWWPGGGALPEIVRYPGVAILATLIITFEAILGTMMLMPRYHRAGLVMTLAALTVFCVALSLMFLMPEPPSCGCLGGAGTSSSDARMDIVIGIVRNISLIVMAGWALRELRRPATAAGRVRAACA